MTEQSQTNKKLRIALAAGLMPIAPWVVLFAINLGDAAAQTAFEAALPSMAENPWLLVALAALVPSTVLGLVVSIFFGPRRQGDPKF